MPLIYTRKYVKARSHPSRRLIKFACDTCDGHIITISRCEGVIAPELSCAAMLNNDCPGVLRQVLSGLVRGQPDFEWRKPRGSESTDAVEYLANGGLLVYPVTCVNIRQRFADTLTDDPKTKAAYQKYLQGYQVDKSTHSGEYRGVVKGQGRSGQE